MRPDVEFFRIKRLADGSKKIYHIIVFGKGGPKLPHDDRHAPEFIKAFQR